MPLKQPTSTHADDKLVGVLFALEHGYGYNRRRRLSRALKNTGRLVVRPHRSLIDVSILPSRDVQSALDGHFREGEMYLTVYFDGQFWIGLVECADADRLRAVRHIFGAEPSDIEVLNFVWHDLLAVAARATVSVEIEASVKPIHNPKRAAREAAKIMRQPALSTKAQIALKLQHEQNQRESRQRTKADREAEADRKREIAREKAKQWQRGH